MTVEHMVWFRFRADVDQPRRDAHAEALRRLADVIPGIVRLAVGWNFTNRAHGAQMGLLITFESKDALAGYQTHPAHVAVARALRADTEEILGMDFEHG